MAEVISLADYRSRCLQNAPITLPVGTWIKMPFNAAAFVGVITDVTETALFCTGLRLYPGNTRVYADRIPSTLRKSLIVLSPGEINPLLATFPALRTLVSSARIPS